MDEGSCETLTNLAWIALASVGTVVACGGLALALIFLYDTLRK